MAEPRFSYTLSKKPKGYHLQDIAKHAIGTFEKIKEEIQEGQDALTQKNKIMNLIELSDTIGAIEQYLEKTYGSTITLEDVLTMKDATKRAFASRRRS
ncbi:MAG: hypothetical protein KC535_01245 [Nanoarchaeota archaeon]|nr:hypothetical protein [Nanoarchaeota archaeon]